MQMDANGVDNMSSEIEPTTYWHQSPRGKLETNPSSSIADYITSTITEAPLSPCKEIGKLRNALRVPSWHQLGRNDTWCPWNSPTTSLNDLLSTHTSPQRAHTRYALSVEEEKPVVSLIKHYTLNGFPLGREDVAEAIQHIVQAMSSERCFKLPLIINRSGAKFLGDFLERNTQEILFGKPSKEEKQLWRACNTETAATHFASLEKIIKEN